MDEFTKYLLAVAVPASVGYVGWSIASIIRLRVDLAALKLHVAENYPKHKDLDEIKKELRQLSMMIYEIAGKLGVPIRSDK